VTDGLSLKMATPIIVAHLSLQSDETLAGQRSTHRGMSEDHALSRRNTSRTAT